MATDRPATGRSRSKYDWETLALRKTVDANGVLLVVFEGRRGSDYGCAVTLESSERFRAAMPRFLRRLADDIEQGATEPEVRFEREDMPDGN